MSPEEIEQYLANTQNQLDSLNQKLVDISNSKSYNEALLQTETEHLCDLKDSILATTGINPDDQQALNEFYGKIKSETEDLISDYNSIQGLQEVLTRIESTNKEDLSSISVPQNVLDSLNKLVNDYGITIPEEGE